MLTGACADSDLVIPVIATRYAALKESDVTPTMEATQAPTITLTPTISPEATLPPAHASAPVITQLTFPDRMFSNSDLGKGEVYFTDLEGDITSAQITVLAGECMDVDFIALEPYKKMIEGEPNEGIFGFEQYCYRCPGISEEVILMQLQLFDEEGYASEPWAYSFLCEDETPYE
jgi:hypothetical protein